jgi:hypothetical protein
MEYEMWYIYGFEDPYILVYEIVQSGGCVQTFRVNNH